MIDADKIYDAFEEYAEGLFDLIKEQVPSPANNPFPNRLVRTGSLRNSLRMYMRKDGVISFAYLRYGIYTDLGTGPNAYQGTTQPFGLPAYRGYVDGRGTGGIEPQLWTSLNSPITQELIRKFEDDVANEIELDLVRIIETTSQRQ